MNWDELEWKTKPQTHATNFVVGLYFGAKTRLQKILVANMYDIFGVAGKLRLLTKQPQYDSKIAAMVGCGGSQSFPKVKKKLCWTRTMA